MKRLFILPLLVLLFAIPLSAQERYHGDGIDDALRFVPLATAVTLKSCGVESRSDWKHFALNIAISSAISAVTTYTLKHTISSERPDGTDNHSFPSGHTSFAFSGAHLLHKEFGHQSPWISVAGYTVAGITAIDRVRRNRHHWGDVCAGAAIGILSTELSYYLTPRLFPQSKSSQLSFSPTSITLQLNY
ncbi:MAG: phosphatase PAP2 family protein [Prevotella sp.]|nr:phosphatase PAP2 family protein [Prevotella sp.]